MFVGAAGFMVWITVGGPGVPEAWTWVRLTLLGVSAFGAFVVATVPGHFLRDHLWDHVLVRHAPRMFGWTVAVLAGLALLEQTANLGAIGDAEPWTLLVVAGLLGLIPESGPHLVFVTLYASGEIPAAVLVTSSVVQDGHGMLPLLAESRGDFVRVKAINLAVGLAAGAVMLAVA
jgi:hypothetical protein